MKKLLLLLLISLILGCGGDEDIEKSTYDYMVHNISNHDISVKHESTQTNLKAKSSVKVKSTSIGPNIKLEVITGETFNKDVYWAVGANDFEYFVEVYKNEIVYEVSGTSPTAQVSYRFNDNFVTENVKLPWRKELKKIGNKMAMVAVVPDVLSSTVNWKILYQDELKAEGSAKGPLVDGSFTLPIRTYLSRN